MRFFSRQSSCLFLFAHCFFSISRRASPLFFLERTKARIWAPHCSAGYPQRSRARAPRLETPASDREERLRTLQGTPYSTIKSAEFIFGRNLPCIENASSSVSGIKRNSLRMEEKTIFRYTFITVAIWRRTLSGKGKDMSRAKMSGKNSLFFIRTIAIWVYALLLLLGCSRTEMTGWKVLKEDSYHNTFSYDRESIKHTSENSVMVWAKSNAARYLYEIDCKNRKARILQEDNKSSSSPQWFDIVGRSEGELIYKAVCP